jgi:RsiW-degrading membrane proteinase PrsW (M82 family)
MAFALLILSVVPILMVLLLGNWDDTILVCCGIGAAVAASVVEIAAERGLFATGLEVPLAARTFLLVALVEEYLKYQAVLIRCGPTVKPSGLMKASVLCALGFGSIENFLYISGFVTTLNGNYLVAASLSRFFLPLTMHIAIAPTLISGLCIKSFKPAAGITLATLFHGLYDYLSYSPSSNSIRIAYVVIAIGGFISATIYKKSSPTGELKT